MNLYNFLICLAFVNVSCFYTSTDYIRDLIITNEHVELAFNMNNFAIQDKFVLNGLEHVIKKIVEDEDDLVNLNNMFTVPEYFSSTNQMCAFERKQRKVREAIETELNIPVPEVPEKYNAKLENLRENEDNMASQFRSSRKSNREDLGKIRREFTVKALGNILKRITDIGNPENVTNLISERSRHDTDLFENRICRALARPETEISPECTCRLIALFMGAKFPKSYIREMEINPDDTCIIRDYYKDDYKLLELPSNMRHYFNMDDLPSNDRTKTFKKIDGQWCQVIDDVVQPLRELLG